MERLVAAARAAIARGDGKGALAAVKDLAVVVPEGRPAAMALVVELEDLDHLEVGDVAWGAFLVNPAVTDLLGWSLGHPSPEAFREIAAEALPTIAPPEVTIARFREALLTETDEDVRRAMVEGLIAIPTPAAAAALLDLFGDSKVSIPVRVQIATHLSGSEDPEALKILRAAVADAPPVLAAGIRAAIAAPEAPQSGFVVTGFVTGTAERMGLEVGDLLLAYDGRSAAEDLNGAIRGALGRDGFVKVDVVRSGARQTLEVRPGWLGLIGRVVSGPRGR